MQQDVPISVIFVIAKKLRSTGDICFGALLTQCCINIHHVPVEHCDQCHSFVDALCSINALGLQRSSHRGGKFDFATSRRSAIDRQMIFGWHPFPHDSPSTMRFRTHSLSLSLCRDLGRKTSAKRKVPKLKSSVAMTVGTFEVVEFYT